MILLGVDLTMPSLMEAEGIETHGILGVVVAPAIEGELAEGLLRIVVTGGEAAVDQLRAARFGSAAQKSAALRMARSTRLVATG